MTLIILGASAQQGHAGDCGFFSGAVLLVPEDLASEYPKNTNIAPRSYIAAVKEAIQGFDYSCPMVLSVYQCESRYGTSADVSCSTGDFTVRLSPSKRVSVVPD